EVMSAAQRALQLGDQDAHVTLTVLKDAVRRISVMPGQRTLVLVSPGFLIRPEFREDEIEIIDRAIRANVVIGSVDARGLYADDLRLDKAQYDPMAETLKAQAERASSRAQEDVLAELADNTGGAFFHNGNDLDAGFRRVAT